MRRFTLLSVLLIQGCSGVVTMDGIQGNDVSEIGIYAVDSSQRVIMADMDNGRFCAEPPPETQMESESSFRMLLEAAINSEEDAGKIEAYRALSEKAKQLYRRSHSVQLYRDVSYYLCQSYVNGALSVSPDGVKELRAEYEKREREILKKLDLIVTQLEELKKEQNSLLGSPLEGGENASPSPETLAKLENRVELMTETVKELKEEADSVDLILKFTEIFRDDIYMVAQMTLAQRAFRSLDSEVSEFYESELSREKGKNEALSSELESFRTKLQTITEQLTRIQTGVDANAEKIKALESEEKSTGSEPEGAATS